MSIELQVNVTVQWRDPVHYDAEHSLPCRVCKTPTHMRDNTDLACHPRCAGDELAREIFRFGQRLADERFRSSVARRAALAQTAAPTAPRVADERFDGGLQPGQVSAGVAR
ncbi:hypothetical protein [Krasilnikovia sp. MM14-A1259]|uniref:hypothetical protein n=1 Tax=Krasilnikovia sp. MM14-A1259 TaxID=3373539 RepID=UPI0038089C99